MRREKAVTRGLRMLRFTAVVLMAGALGTWVSTEPAEAVGGECGWECKGLACKPDPAYPNIRCEEEVPGEVCTNFECSVTQT